MHGSGSGPCSSWSTATCAARWLTPYSGFPSPTASAFAAATPTSSAPASPGPLVTAIASTSCNAIPAVAQARSTVGTIASRWARDATSGTTPPKRACSSTLEATASASRVLPRTMPTPVSSQEVSKPRTRGSSFRAVIPSHQCLPHDQRVVVAGLVVAAADPHRLEAVAGVETLCGVVVSTHLQPDLCALSAHGLFQECLQQDRPESLALVPAGHRDVLDPA